MVATLKKAAATCAANKIKAAFVAVTIVTLLGLWDRAENMAQFGWYVIVTAFVVAVIYKGAKEDILNIIELLGNKEKDTASKIALGHSLTSILDYAYDYGVYIPVIDAFSGQGIVGVLKAYAILTTGSIIASWLEIVVYDKLGDDWLGWEAAKEADDFGQEFLAKFNPQTAIGKLAIPLVRLAIRVFAWALKKNIVTAHIAMSLAFDPFHTTIYLRKGSEYNGLSARDWKIFFTSAIISNAWWTIRIFGLIYIVKGIYHLIVSFF